MVKKVFLFFFLAHGLLCYSQEKRLAIVIGNGNYIHGGALKNPTNDSKAIANVLANLGFDVLEYENLGLLSMKQAIDDFGNKLNNYDVGLFYYAGHGIQSKGLNYLIPTDANLFSESDLEFKCVRADRVLSKMESVRSKTNLIILDACRDNPFERAWTRSITGRGLAQMDAPYGSLIAFATAPGNTASDGTGNNGLYTYSILQFIEKPNITCIEMFQRVRREVREKSFGQQIPWEATSLEEDFYFVPISVIDDKRKKIEESISLTNVSGRSEANLRLIERSMNNYLRELNFYNQENLFKCENDDLSIEFSLNDEVYTGYKLMVINEIPVIDIDCSCVPFWGIFELPTFKIDIENKTKKKINIDSIYFDVKKSLFDPTPYVNLQSGHEGSFEIIINNSGWDVVSDCLLYFNISPTSTDINTLEPGLDYKIFFNKINNRKVIKLDSIFRNLEVNVEKLKDSEIKKEINHDDYSKLLGPFSSGKAFITGKFIYSGLSPFQESLIDTLNFNLEIILQATNVIRAIAGLRQERDITLDIDRDEYRLSHPIHTTLKKKKSTQLQFKVGATKSSFHLFDLNIVYNNHQMQKISNVVYHSYIYKPISYDIE